MAARRLVSLWSGNGSRLKWLRVAYVSTDPKPATSLVKKESEDVETIPADKIVIIYKYNCTGGLAHCIVDSLASSQCLVCLTMRLVGW